MNMTVEFFRRFANSQTRPSAGNNRFEFRLSRQLLLWVCAACIPGLVLGLLAYYWTVGPLENSLMDVQARSIARDIDAAIQVRAASIEVAAGNLNLQKLADSGQLDNLLKTTHKAFPDFISMEILDEHGDVLALVGELPLSEARHGLRRSTAAKVGTMSYRDRDMFVDDPDSSSFLISLKHETPEGRVWFSRTRFTRDAIKQALSSPSNGFVAVLTPVTEAKEQNSSITTLYKSWSGRVAGKDARLRTPGWLVTVAPPSKSKSWKFLAGVVAAFAVLVAALLCAFRRFSSWAADQAVDATPLAYSSGTGLPAPQVVERFQSAARKGLNPPAAMPQETMNPDDHEYDRWTPQNMPLGIKLDDESESAVITENGPEASLAEHDLKTDILGPTQLAAPIDSDEFGISEHETPLSDSADTSTLPPIELALQTDSDEFGISEHETPLSDSADSTTLPPIELALPTDSDEFNVPERESALPGISDTAEVWPGDELPEVLDLTWFEPSEDELHKTEPDQCYASGDLLASESTEFPECLEVTWTEPIPDNKEATDENETKHSTLFIAPGA
jgi:hypothetical protein